MHSLPPVFHIFYSDKKFSEQLKTQLNYCWGLTEKKIAFVSSLDTLPQYHLKGAS